MPKLLAGAGNKKAAVLNAVDISGFDTDPATGSFNEHVWYDFPTVRKITATLSKPEKHRSRQGPPRAPVLRSPSLFR